MNIYRKHPHTDAYALNDDNVYTPYAYLATEKRFSDGELAAEVWHFDYEDFDRTMRADPDELSEEEWDAYIERRIEAEAALRRFATLPHFDQEDA